MADAQLAVTRHLIMKATRSARSADPTSIQADAMSSHPYQTKRAPVGALFTFQLSLALALSLTLAGFARVSNDSYQA